MLVLFQFPTERILPKGIGQFYAAARGWFFSFHHHSAFHFPPLLLLLYSFRFVNLVLFCRFVCCHVSHRLHISCHCHRNNQITFHSRFFFSSMLFFVFCSVFVCFRFNTQRTFSVFFYVVIVYKSVRNTLFSYDVIDTLNVNIQSMDVCLLNQKRKKKQMHSE